MNMHQHTTYVYTFYILLGQFVTTIYEFYLWTMINHSLYMAFAAGKELVNKELNCAIRE